MGLLVAGAAKVAVQLAPSGPSPREGDQPRILAVDGQVLDRVVIDRLQPALLFRAKGLLPRGSPLRLLEALADFGAILFDGLGQGGVATS